MSSRILWNLHSVFLSGDVKLENLEVKETALDDLDLPVKLKFGYLSSLVLKIPWKNLYNEPVIANIDGLHLIVVPNKGVVYNEEKVGLAIILSYSWNPRIFWLDVFENRVRQWIEVWALMKLM